MLSWTVKDEGRANQASTSGKSTLIDALFHLVKLPKGQAFLDGIDICSLTKGDITSVMSGVSQTSCFDSSRTLLRNLDPSQSSSRSQVETLIHQVLNREVATQIISSLDTQWSDCILSASSQRQLAIIRCLLRANAHVYVLDEPTTR